MTSSNMVPWATFEEWRSTAFLTSGGVTVVAIALKQLEYAAVLTPPEWVNDLFGYLPIAVALVGVIGLYPRLREAAPRLSRAGLALAGVGLLGSVGSFVGERIGEFVGVGGEVPPGPVVILPLLALLFSPFAHLLFGVASWRTRIPSRPIALSLLALFGSWLSLVAGIVTGMRLFFTLEAAVFAMAALSTGYLLRLEGVPADRTDSRTALTEI